HARIRAHLAHLTSAAIELGEETAAIRVRARVEHVRIARVGRDVAVLRAAGAERLGRRGAAPEAAPAALLRARDAGLARILLRAADVGRQGGRRDDLVALTRPIALPAPRRTVG